MAQQTFYFGLKDVWENGSDTMVAGNTSII